MSFPLKLLKSGNDSFNLLIKESSSFKYSFSLILFSEKETIFISLIFNWISKYKYPFLSGIQEINIKLFSINIFWFFLILYNWIIIISEISNSTIHFFITSSKLSI